MVSNEKKGRLIVLEGIDGSGKTTQCKRLAEALAGEGRDVERLREPTDGPHGRRIRQLARPGGQRAGVEEELDLFISDRRENVRDNILPALERGALVLMDRYYYSSIAYQGARGADPARIRRRNEEFAPPADLLIYLTIPVDLAVERIESGRGAQRDLFEKEDYLRKVKDLFDAMDDPGMVRVDASRDREAVFQDISNAVRDLLEKTA